MLWLFLHLHLLAVLSDAAAPPPPPRSVLADRWRLTWRPGPGGEDSNFTVYYQRYNSLEVEGDWEVAPACDGAPSLWCDVAFSRAGAEHGCVRLQVRAQRGGLTSEPGRACSAHGDSCTPEVRLSTRPGSLTVHLTQNNSLFGEHAAHATHRIYFGQEGAPLQDRGTSSFSWTVDGLEAGRRYCARVEYVIHNQPAGLPSCSRCELVPEHVPSTQAVVGRAVAVVLLVVLVVLVAAYVLICHRGHIKRFLKPPFEIPEDLLQPLRPAAPPLVLSPPVEHASLLCLAETP